MRFDNRALKEAARKSLARSSCDHRRLVLIHTGVVCLANILISLLVFYLNRQIEDTGGIGGLDRRNLLSTVTTVAQLAQTVLLLFWGFGYTSVSIDLARDHIPERDCLLDGFRLVGPILRLTLLKGLLMGGTLFFSIQVASFFFCMTPWADPLMDFTVIYLESTDYAAMEAALIAVLEQIQLPMMGITALVFLVLSILTLHNRKTCKQCIRRHTPARWAWIIVTLSSCAPKLCIIILIEPIIIILLTTLN
jgi:hypothetical protein